jgi:hypothetical protein
MIESRAPAIARRARAAMSALSFALVILSGVGAAVAAPNRNSAPSGGVGGGGDSRYSARTAQRWDLISYLTEQKRVMAAQDAKYGRAKGQGLAFPDVVLMFRQNNQALARNGSELGSETAPYARAQALIDDLITSGNKYHLFNFDVGLEGFYGAGNGFAAAPGATQASWSASESGGGLLLRPIGRSSQDSGLIVKGGYLSLQETGLWSASQASLALSAPYAGAEAKLYLLPFLGLRADYQRTIDSSAGSLQGTWRLERFQYGAFIELYCLAVEAYGIWANYTLDQPSGETVDRAAGTGLSASLFF